MARSIVLLLCAAASAAAQSSSSTLSSTSTQASSSPSSSSSSTAATTTTSNAAFSFSQAISFITTDVPTPAFIGTMYTYASVNGQTTVETSLSSRSQNASNSQITRTHSSASVTQIVGGASNQTATTTSSAATASNTIPCNGYPEFCTRKYSNVTEVCAHNSNFAVKNNAASNQVYGITTQLNDGIRMLQGETQYVNDTIYNCHTSCDLLNAGTWESSLETLVTWLEQHPYDVVTWLIGNSDFVSVDKYTSAIENSGIQQYLYQPKYVPQHRDQWPTLGEMILSGKRVVMFMDYNADQQSVPYILDEFTHMWETPFSPTNQSFPCTQQRPPNLNQTAAREDYMYVANHNLNVAISLSAILGQSGDSAILIPNTAYINQTNGELDQYGQVGAAALNCTADWGRPPNFLLVDYYNFGTPEQGSVFRTAAAMNNVTYRGQCCGSTQSAASGRRASLLALGAAVAFAAILVI